MQTDSFHRFDLSFSQLDFPFESILKALRVTDDSDENPIVYIAKDLYNLIPEICRIRGGYIILKPEDINVKSGVIVIENVVLDCGKQVCGYLKGSEQIILFICTAGERFTELRHDYDKNNDYLSGFIVDTFGSLIVESAMDHIQKQIEVEAAKLNCKITNRYSPGYCNWPLQDQQKIFDLLPGNDCNIQLTESSLMLPIKSISGFIGVGRQVRKSKYACDICNYKGCIYNR